MKIVYVTAMMPFGAQEAFLIPEVVELRRQGHEVLLVPRQRQAAIVHEDARPLEAITLAEPLCSASILCDAARMAARYPRRTIQALALFRGSGFLSVLLKNLAVFPKALWLARVALARGTEHIHAHWALTTATMAMIASRVSGIPWSLTAHRGDIVDDNLLRTKVEQASFLRVISANGLKLAESIAGKVIREKTAVIHMGVAVPEPSGFGPSAMSVATLLCPANLLPVKGHCHLLEAMRLLKTRGCRCRLEIAGDGPLRGDLERQAAALEIADRVKFLGQVPHDQIVARYRDAQVRAVVLPSVDLGGGVHEGIPVALMEAMSYGVPVVSTTTGGIGELLRDEAGLLVPPANPLALADAIGRLIQDASLRERLARAGRNRIADEYAIDRVVAALAEHWAGTGSRRVRPRTYRLDPEPVHQAA